MTFAKRTRASCRVCVVSRVRFAVPPHTVSPLSLPDNTRAPDASSMQILGWLGCGMRRMIARQRAQTLRTHVQQQAHRIITIQQERRATMSRGVPLTTLIYDDNEGCVRAHYMPWHPAWHRCAARLKYDCERARASWEIAAGQICQTRAASFARRARWWRRGRRFWIKCIYAPYHHMRNVTVWR